MEPDQPPRGSTNPPPHQPPHHHTSTCTNCGNATAFAQPAPWSETSPPPVYRPIRAPAINLPPNQNLQQTIIMTPVPLSQKVPPINNISSHHFLPPTKRINSHSDLLLFRDSPVAKNFLGFVVSLSESIRSRKLSETTLSPLSQLSPTLAALVSILDALTRFVDDTPPLPQSARYGNLAYRDWHARMSENAETLIKTLLPESLYPATVELVPYFTDSFGNAARIDYGTGHETNFAAWLYCLARLGVIKEEDYEGVVGRVFVKYMELMRKLQIVYSLEPAGSHGVWGLDDYHFLPYVFGASQLIDHKYMKPKSIHNEDILENFADEYMYLQCIVFIKKVKKGLFAEHSPMLDDISGVPNWKKVNSGLLKMYKVEVMEKVPIMQHFLFGSIIKWEEGETTGSVE